MSYRKFTIFFLCLGGGVATISGVMMLIIMAFDPNVFGVYRGEALKMFSIFTPICAIITIIGLFLFGRVK